MNHIIKDNNYNTSCLTGQKRKLTENEFLFGICFLIGAVWVTILARGKTPENTLLSQALSAVFLEQGWNGKMLLLQCLYSRGIQMLLLLFLAYTPFRKLTFRLVTAWLGVSLGILFKLFFCWYGMGGVGLFLVSMLPQALFYWMSYGLLYWESEPGKSRSLKKPVGILIVMGVVIMGIMIECYVNPFLLRNYLKIFLG